eukprot:4381228-Amphidinium_carterae.2
MSSSTVGAWARNKIIKRIGRYLSGSPQWTQQFAELDRVSRHGRPPHQSVKLNTVDSDTQQR